MRKTIAFLFALVSFAACDLNKLEPAQTKAFMKYFGDLGNTRGVDLLKLDDGYLMLGNNTNSGNSTVFLIKTDFPVPEPPKITKDSPFSTLRSTPFRTFLDPNLLRKLHNSIFTDTEFNFSD